MPWRVLKIDRRERNLPQAITKFFLKLTTTNNRAVYTKENKLRLTLAMAYIIKRERNHLYKSRDTSTAFIRPKARGKDSAYERGGDARRLA